MTSIVDFHITKQLCKFFFLFFIREVECQRPRISLAGNTNLLLL